MADSLHAQPDLAAAAIAIAARLAAPLAAAPDLPSRLAGIPAILAA